MSAKTPSALMFHSLELEGEARGMNTLFIQGDVPAAEILHAIATRRFIEHVYFGAVYMGLATFGSPSVVNPNTVARIVHHIGLVTVEVTEPGAATHFGDTWFDIPSIQLLIPGGSFKDPEISRCWFNAIEHHQAFDRVQIKWESEMGIYTVSLANVIATRKGLYKDLDKGTQIWP